MIDKVNYTFLTLLQNFLLRHTKSNSWEYGVGEYTDQPPEELIVQSVRARLLDFLPQEIPYSLHCEIEFYNIHKGNSLEDDPWVVIVNKLISGHIFASVKVTCPTERIERLICGIENGKLKQITERVTSDLVETFSKPVSLTISTFGKPKSNK